MAAALELLAEADRRGLLPTDKKAMYEEAKRRGIVGDAGPQEPATSPRANFQSGTIAEPRSSAFPTGDTSRHVEIGPDGLPLTPFQTPLTQRSAASLPTKPERVLSYLEATYGKGNAVLRPDGEFLVKSGDKWSRFNPPGLDLGDIAGGAGAALEMAPSMVGAAMTSGAGAIAGGMFGTEARQVGSALLPGQNTATAGELLRETAISGAAALAGNVLPRGILGIKNAPGNVLTYVVDRDGILARQVASETPYAVESRRLAEELGTAIKSPTGIIKTPFPLTQGQETGAEGALKIEGAIGQHWSTATRMGEFYNKQLTSLSGVLDRQLKSAAKKTAGSWGIGEDVKQTYANIVKTAEGARSEGWKTGMKEVEKIAGNNRFIKTDSLKNGVDDRISELQKTLTGGDSPEVAELLKLKENLIARNNRMSAAEAQAELSQYSKGARGGGKLFSALDDGTDRAISSKLLGALNADLDAAASNPKYGAAAKALSAVRSNYKNDSIKLENMSNSKLGQILGGVPLDRETKLPLITGETVTDRIMGMRPSEIMDVRDLLAQHNPSLLADMKRNMLERMFEDKSSDAVFRGLGGETTISPRKLGANYGKWAGKWDSLANGKERSDIENIMKLVARIAKSEPQGSQTASRMEIFKDILGAVTHPVTGGVRIAVKEVGAKKVAELMIDPAARKAVQTMTFASPKSKAYGAAIGVVGNILYRDSEDQANVPAAAKFDDSVGRGRMSR